MFEFRFELLGVVAFDDVFSGELQDLVALGDGADILEYNLENYYMPFGFNLLTRFLLIFVSNIVNCV